VPILTAHLPYEARCKSRLLLKLDNGEIGALVLPRGRVLRDGERVRIEDGREVQIIAAEELLLEGIGTDPLLIAKAAYHLGNRHVAVQLLHDRVRFLHDHVLGEMVQGLGLTVLPLTASFEPEGGAYGHHHAHGIEAPLSKPKIHSFEPSC